MKTPFHYFNLLLLSFLYFNSVQAQEDSLNRSFKKSNYLKIESFGSGGSLDLGGNGSNPDAELMSKRSALGFAGTILRVTHLFSNKLGWYTTLEMDLIKEKRSPYYKASFNDAIGDIMMGVFFGGLTPNIVLDVGMVYRIEKKNWDINPRLGLGYGTLLTDLDSDKSRKMEDGTTARTIYKQRSGNIILKTGIGAQYFFGKRSFVSFNVDIQQPLEKSYAELSVLIDDDISDYRKYSTARAGRNLSFGVGYGLVLGKRKVSYQ